MHRRSIGGLIQRRVCQIVPELSQVPGGLYPKLVWLIPASIHVEVVD